MSIGYKNMIDLVRKWQLAQKSYEESTFDPHSINNENLPAYIHLADLLKPFLYLGDGTTILDLAAGNGIFGGRPCKEVDYIYFEKDQKIVRCDILTCQMKNGPFVQCDAHSLPFGRESFDGVSCVFSIDHFVDPQCIFKEVFEILKPGGTFFVASAVKHTKRHFKPSSHPHHIYDFSVDALTTLYGEVDFVNIDFELLCGNRIIFFGEKPDEPKL